MLTVSQHFFSPTCHSYSMRRTFKVWRIFLYSTTGDNSHLVSVPDHRILDKRVEKQTVSAQEIDIIAAFILNRLQVNSSDATQHANPGIAFIWNDERARRSRLIEVCSHALNVTEISPINNAPYNSRRHSKCPIIRRIARMPCQPTANNFTKAP